VPADVIYLDYNASTPCDPTVLDAMLPFLGSEYGNPASRSHRPGQAAFAALENARATVASSLGAASAAEITFTSGATEANNLVLKGIAEAIAGRGRHLITQATEHASVLAPLRYLADRGWRLTVLGVDAGGRIRLDELAAELRSETALVSLMLANNETGTVQPVSEAAEIVHHRGALLHCDAAQGPGKLTVDTADLGADFVTVSAHKVYGPKGIGALWCSRRAPSLRPLLHGGGHEDGRRSGTPNLPGAVGLAAALELAAGELPDEATRLAGLRDLLERRIVEQLDGCSVNGDLQHRLPNTSNLAFGGVEGTAIIVSLADLAVSSGSACTSSHPEPSPVLRAMGLPRALAAASIRFSLGRQTTAEEVERAAERVVTEVRRLRTLPRSVRR
jgi:cysteine desulfurase